MTLYYAETERGCCIRRALSEEQALTQILREVGTTYAGVRLLREATEADLAWVKGMGGRVPADYAPQDPE